MVERFEKVNGRLDEMKEQITERQARGEQMEIFIKELEIAGPIEQFDEDLFLGLVESIEVGIDKFTMRFKDGTQVEG